MTISRVALVSPYALSIYGGVQEQVLAMSRELSRREIDVLVVAPNGHDAGRHDTTATVQSFGRLLAVPANGSRAPVTLSPRASKMALDAIATFQPDVVHLHEPFAPVLGYATLRAHRYPAVGTFHRSGGGPAYSLTKPLLVRLARGLDVATAVSTAAASTIQRGARVDATVLFNGFETERFRVFARSTNETPLVVFVGRLEQRKGVDTLIDAARALVEPAPWRAVVVGDGPQRAALEARNGVGGPVEFVGAVSDDEKRQWLRRADVAVATSTHGESFGLVILEAMASETRVVVSNIAGYREAAMDRGVLFSPGDSTSLANAITGALASRDEATIARAREHAEQWSMSSLVDHYLELYDRARRHRVASR